MRLRETIDEQLDPDGPDSADSTDSDKAVKDSAQPRFLHAVRGPALLAAAALLIGWGGHRVASSFALRLAQRHAASLQPPAPVDEALRRDFCFVPGGRHVLGDPDSGAPARTALMSRCWFGRTEVTCAAFAEFLNDTRNDEFASPQFVREGPRWQAVRADHAVTRVTLELARDYAQWFGLRQHARARLPQADEWEAAARGGVGGAPYAWGWGDPAERALFAAPAPGRIAQHPANGFGLFDCCGGVAEWCEPGPDDAPGTAPARGGSWADRDPAALQAGRLLRLPAGYRDADVGFRIVLEAPPG